MIVWGGDTLLLDAGELDDGARYNPTLDSWTVTTAVGAPAVRAGHSAVWSGTEMLIWGGASGWLPSIPHANGYRYNPVANSWSAMAATALSARSGQFAHWTGTQMLLWGGSSTNDGIFYNPTSDTWSATMSVASAPAVGQSSGCSAWTGSSFLVWGGTNGGVRVNTGAIYSVAGDSWTATSVVGVPAARELAFCAWTGSQLVIWGGLGIGVSLDDGGVLTP